jgi:hypothetical protein
MYLSTLSADWGERKDYYVYRTISVRDTISKTYEVSTIDKSGLARAKIRVPMPGTPRTDCFLVETRLAVSPVRRMRRGKTRLDSKG